MGFPFLRELVTQSNLGLCMIRRVFVKSQQKIEFILAILFFVIKRVFF